jgi:uncharacterized membrane protein YhaH (DUF805 family)
MRGTVLQYDDNAGSGYISGDDGVRYTFKRSDLQQLRPIAAGMKVDFVPNAGAASEIYMIDASGAIASGPGPAPGSGAAPAYGAAPGYGGGYAPGLAPTVAYTGEDLGLWDYFKKVMGKSFNGEGRARRKEYWSFVLFTWLIFVVLMILMMVIAGGAISAAMSSSSYYGYGYSDGGFGALIGALGVWFFVYIVIALVFLPASITVMIRRLHDIGMSGWFYLLAFVPYIGGIFLLVCAFIPSQAYVNKYGPIPKPAPTVYGA